MKLTLIDSPVANIASIARALREVGAELDVTSDPDAIALAPRLILPGVGTFGAAVTWLQRRGIDRALRSAVASGAWLLGICVGHQLLFEGSEELGQHPGLGFFPGTVTSLDRRLAVPQIGWNRIAQRDRGNPLFAGIEPDTAFYFVNSYAASGGVAEIATASYGASFTAAAATGRVSGVQFHPEKSSTAGLRLLRNFAETGS